MSPVPGTGPDTEEVLEGLKYEDPSLQVEQPGQLYLFPCSGAALRALRRAPLGAPVFLGDTPGHVHAVVQKHLLPHAAHQLLLLWLGHELVHAAFAAAAAVGQVPRGAAVSAVRGQNPWGKEEMAVNADEERNSKGNGTQSVLHWVQLKSG